VCLSLLGTWHGTDESQKWHPDSANLWRVLVSIQGMILIGDPYFNEPNARPAPPPAHRARRRRPPASSRRACGGAAGASNLPECGMRRVWHAQGFGMRRAWQGAALTRARGAAGGGHAGHARGR